jgi:(R,R)-butanediol dehydrogenase/meso-butanediol dehydrogenase/diacetyl reductase
MKALVYHGNRDVRYQDFPDPVPGDGDALIKIDYCGICATDIEEYQFGPTFIGDQPNPVTGRTLPIVIGHELTGTVIEVGRDVTSVAVEDRVVINGVLACGECWWCRGDKENQCPNNASVGFGADGGLADYIAWPARQAVTLPDNVSSEEAGLVEPTSVGHHAVRRGNITAGDQVAVLGAGTVGLLAMQAARAMGAWVCAMDVRPMSLERADELGADALIDSSQADAAEQLLELTDGRGPDVVIDAAGAPKTPHLAIDLVRRGGRVVLVAIYTSVPEFDFNSLLNKEIELAGSIGYQQQDVEAAVKMIGAGQIKTAPLISGIIGLDEVVDVGYARMMSPTKDVFRLLVSPSGGR